LAAVQLQFSGNVAAPKIPSQTLAGLHYPLDCIWTSLLPQLNHFPAAIQVIWPLWCLCTELELVLPALRSRSHWSVTTVSLPKFLSHYYNDETSNHLNICFIQPGWSDWVSHHYHVVSNPRRSNSGLPFIFHRLRAEVGYIHLGWARCESTDCMMINVHSVVAKWLECLFSILTMDNLVLRHNATVFFPFWMTNEGCCMSRSLMDTRDQLSAGYCTRYVELMVSRSRTIFHRSQFKQKFSRICHRNPILEGQGYMFI
jgi:hypothetical protein